MSFGVTVAVCMLADWFIFAKINLTTLSIASAFALMVKCALCVAVDAVIVLAIKKATPLTNLINDLLGSRALIWSLAKNDFKTKYAGSYLGITWAFVQPIVTVLVYWFVFEYGLKAASPMEGVPFVLWLTSGLIPWFFFSEALLNATNCMAEYSYLVKKVVFKISILPIVKIVSAFFVHLVFVGFIVVIFAMYKFNLTLYTLQFAYYSMCVFAFALSLSFATSSIVIFFKDLGQLISIFLQIGMWLTPIMWSFAIVPEKHTWVLKLNPMFYIVEGYRDSFINHVWFWERYLQTAYFWSFTGIMFIFGAIIFKKLKPHFADVL